MRAMRHRWTLLLLGVLAGCSPAKPAADPPAPAPAEEAEPELRAFPNEEFNASIVHVLAHPNRYHGRPVQLHGFLHVRFEGTALYLSKDDADYGITVNGFWVEFDGDPAARAAGKGLDGKYVLIEGTFDKNSRGHLSLWSGALKKVTRVLELTRSRK